MKKLLLMALLSLCWIFLPAAYIVDYPVTLHQPDGTEIHCFASGDEYYNWYHDANHFTIIANSEGYYCYAVLSGDKVVASQYVVGSVDPASVGIKPGVSISAEAKNAIRDSFVKNTPPKTPIPGYDVSKGKLDNFGEMNNLVVYIYFKDQTPFPEDTAYYWGMFNGSGDVSNQTLQNYFETVSYNQFSIQSYFFPLTETTEILAYQDSHIREYYMPYDPVTAPSGYQENERADREFQLLHDAIEFIADEVPENINLDHNHDGYVDNVVFIVRGDVTAWSTLLWPHRWSLYSHYAYIHGLRVYDFNFQIETHLNSSEASVLCHEMFHSLGAPDLYRYSDNTIAPIGNWDVMSGNLHPAQSMSAYMKYKYGGWIDEIPEITEGGVYYLNTPYSSENCVYKIASPNSSAEYFVLEYRNKTHPFETKMPGEGLLIFRAYPSINGNAGGPPDELYVFRYGGTNTLTNGNINNANFNSAVGRTEFDDNTNPPCFLKDNTPGGIFIKNVGSVSTQISFEVWFDVVPTAEFEASSTEVTVGCPVDFSATSYNFVDNWFWDFEDATPSSSEEQNPTGIVFNSPGYKTVTLTVMNEHGDGTITKEGYIYVNDTDGPSVSFSSDRQTVCLDGQTIHFYGDGDLCPTSWQWSFSPNTVTFIEGTDANSQNPVVSFDVAGDYDVTLSVSNANKTNTLTVENYVSMSGISIHDYHEDFENINNIQEAGWVVENPDNKLTWELAETLENNGVNHAPYVNFFKYNGVDKKDYLISPYFKLDGRYQLHFRHAYRMKNSAVSDTLNVSISTDCGDTWQLLESFYEDGSNNFVTGPAVNYDFIPQDVTDWCGNMSDYADCLTVDLSDYAGYENVMIRFEAVKLVGNNLFIDDIYFESLDGINDYADMESFTLFPNPNNGIFTLRCDGNYSNVKVDVFNITGTRVMSKNFIGSNSVIDLSDCPDGLYIVNITTNNYSQKLKLIKQ